MSIVAPIASGSSGECEVVGPKPVFGTPGPTRILMVWVVDWVSIGCFLYTFRLLFVFIIVVCILLIMLKLLMYIITIKFCESKLKNCLPWEI